MPRVTGTVASSHNQFDDLRCVLRDVRGQLTRVGLLVRLLASRAGRPGGWTRRTFGGRIQVPFRTFKAEFELSQGEIAPYAQMVRDLEDGVIPVGSQVRDWTVVDCGANVGLFSLFLKDAARVVAIEPNPSVNRRLKRNLEMNGVTATVIEAAVSSQDGVVKMDFASGPSVLTEIGESGTDVRSMSLDTIFAEAEVDTVDLLKLDVERHEIDAIRGAAEALGNGRIKRIVAEFVDADALAALDEHLGACGFHRAVTGRFNARFEL